MVPRKLIRYTAMARARTQLGRNSCSSAFTVDTVAVHA